MVCNGWLQGEKMNKEPYNSPIDQIQERFSNAYQQWKLNELRKSDIETLKQLILKKEQKIQDAETEIESAFAVYKHFAKFTCIRCSTTFQPTTFQQTKCRLCSSNF
jgi:transposase